MRIVAVLRVGFPAPLRALAIAASLLDVGCGGATEPCATPSRVAGTWSYSSVQTAPASATVSGTLRLTGGACGQFSGSLDATEIDAVGVTRRTAGDLSGSIVDSTTVQFDVFLSGVARQHLSTFRGDSLKGDWFEAASGGASGSFIARRTGAR